MSTIDTKVKYHKTGQLRNAITHVKKTLTFVGLDDDGNPIYDSSKIKGKIKYRGSVKLHGTHASIMSYPSGDKSYHSKEGYLGCMACDGEVQQGSDNAEFMQTMVRRNEGVDELEDIILQHFRAYGLDIKISGEWCGQGIQKGVGISFLDKKSFFVFGIKIEDDWVDISDFEFGLEEFGIYNIYHFPYYEIEVDLNEPEVAATGITKMVEEVEEQCPVSEELGITECNVGEGIVWVPVDQELRNDTGTWFKTKGEKHSTTKVKKLVSVSPEKLQSIQDFVDYAVTENRLEQGLQEVGADVTLTGKFIGWVNRDINTEEGDVLEANNLSMKDVGKFISNKAREWYMSEL